MPFYDKSIYVEPNHASMLCYIKELLVETSILFWLKKMTFLMTTVHILNRRLCCTVTRAYPVG